MTADPTWHGIALDADTALALLDWQREMGADEPMLDAPCDRYAAAPPAPAAAPAAARPPSAALASPPADADGGDLVARATALAARAATLDALAAAIDGFDGLDLRKGARSLVFADGNPRARVMIVGEAPDEEEDRAGRPFVGRAGQLLDRMLAAIGLSRDAPDPARAAYVTTVLPWRPPGDRQLQPAEIAAMRPFLARHVELADPDLVLLMGNDACRAALDRDGILRLRGAWTQAFGRPALPMMHPTYLLRTPVAKREAWADLLDVAARLA